MTSPARKLKRSAVKNIVRFPAIKSNGGKTILVESILESKYCLHLEFDPEVKAYFPQPKTFNVPNEIGESTYTPDFEIHFVSSSRRYVEVKPLEKSESDHFQDLFANFESTIEDPNCDFKVVDEFEVYAQPLLSNYEKLYKYRKRPLLDMANLHRCAAIVKMKIPLSRLIALLGDNATIREVYSWLALGYLQFDMKKEQLTMSTEVEFNVS